MRNPINAINFIFLPKKPIILLSHMRSRSSLLSHMIGAHSEVAGYYEMHQHYFSWKSILKQKLNILKDRSISIDSVNYTYDKLLHNSILLNLSYLKSVGTKFIIMTREPEESLKSIMKMGERNGSDLIYEEKACKYYFDRLDFLSKLSLDIKDEYFFLDSSNLIDNTNFVLEKLSKFIGLSSKLSDNYGTFEKTGKKVYGDPSEVIKEGKVVKAESDETITINGSYDEDYTRVLGHLKSGSVNYNS